LNRGIAPRLPAIEYAEGYQSAQKVAAGFSTASTPELRCVCGDACFCESKSAWRGKRHLQRLVGQQLSVTSAIREYL
jgi:hypothetical protein